VRRWFYQLAILLLGKPIQYLFRLQPVNARLVPRSGGGILVANHVTLFDPIWIYDVLRRPVYFVATDELFRGRLLGSLLRWFGAFPKRKAASDLKTMKNMMQVLGRGGLVGLYPEGVRTWDGTNGPLIPTIARLIRRMKVPVYTCRLEGGYLAWPRWASKWRRIPVRMVFNRLYAKSGITESEQQILSEACHRFLAGGASRTVPHVGDGLIDPTPRREHLPAPDQVRPDRARVHGEQFQQFVVAAGLEQGAVAQAGAPRRRRRCRTSVPAQPGAAWAAVGRPSSMQAQASRTARPSDPPGIRCRADRPPGSPRKGARATSCAR
jgi:1-acyl-sn-glycerol-3-phosphate acyltransferase